MSTCVPLVVLDWLIFYDCGNIIREGKSSVKSMSSILSPRRECDDYKIGDRVLAKFGPQNLDRYWDLRYVFFILLRKVRMFVVKGSI